MRKTYKLLLVLLSIAVVAAFAFYLEISSRTFQFYGSITSCVPTTEKVVALTFDDGPSAYTREVLDVLVQNKVRATFFLIGSELEQHMEEGRLLIQAGEEIGNHSYSHNRLVFKAYATIKREVDKTDSLIRAVGYQGEILFRPPGCKKFIGLPHYLDEVGKKTITWDVEPESYAETRQSAERIIQYVTAHTKPGSIILLHVMTGSAGESRRSLDGIIKGLHAKGYKFVTVSELLHLKKS